MYLQTTIAVELLYVIVHYCVKAEWNTNDYMKREHSLIKPYQGRQKNFDFFYLQFELKL